MLTDLFYDRDSTISTCYSIETNSSSASTFLNEYGMLTMYGHVTDHPLTRTHRRQVCRTRRIPVPASTTFCTACATSTFVGEESVRVTPHPPSRHLEPPTAPTTYSCRPARSVLPDSNAHTRSFGMSSDIMRFEEACQCLSPVRSFALDAVEVRCSPALLLQIT